MEDLERQLQMIAECLPPSPFRETVEKVTAAAIARIEELERNQCDVCSGDGWVENRVERRGACVCMTEREPFQILLTALEEIATGLSLDREAMEGVARKALHAVLPLDYAKSV